MNVFEFFRSVSNFHKSVFTCWTGTGVDKTHNSSVVRIPRMLPLPLLALLGLGAYLIEPVHGQVREWNVTPVYRPDSVGRHVLKPKLYGLVDPNALKGRMTFGECKRFWPREGRPYGYIQRSVKPFMGPEVTAPSEDLICQPVGGLRFQRLGEAQQNPDEEWGHCSVQRMVCSLRSAAPYSDFPNMYDGKSMLEVQYFFGVDPSGKDYDDGKYVYTTEQSYHVEKCFNRKVFSNPIEVQNVEGWKTEVCDPWEVPVRSENFYFYQIFHVIGEGDLCESGRLVVVERNNFPQYQEKLFSFFDNCF